MSSSTKLAFAVCIVVALLNRPWAIRANPGDDRGGGGWAEGAGDTPDVALEYPGCFTTEFHLEASSTRQHPLWPDASYNGVKRTVYAFNVGESRPMMFKDHMFRPDIPFDSVAGYGFATDSGGGRPRIGVVENVLSPKASGLEVVDAGYSSHGALGRLWRTYRTIQSGGDGSAPQDMVLDFAVEPGIYHLTVAFIEPGLPSSADGPSMVRLRGDEGKDWREFDMAEALGVVNGAGQPVVHALLTGIFQSRDDRLRITIQDGEGGPDSHHISSIVLWQCCSCTKPLTIDRFGAPDIVTYEQTSGAGGFVPAYAAGSGAAPFGYGGGGGGGGGGGVPPINDQPRGLPPGEPALDIGFDPGPLSDFPEPQRFDTPGDRDDDEDIPSYDPEPVPEPAGVVMLGMGLAAVMLRRPGR